MCVCVYISVNICIHTYIYTYRGTSESGLSQIRTQYNKPLYKGHDLWSQYNSYNTLFEPLKEENHSTKDKSAEFMSSPKCSLFGGPSALPCLPKTTVFFIVLNMFFSTGGHVRVGPLPPPQGGYPPLFPHGLPPDAQRMPHPLGHRPPLLNPHPMYRYMHAYSM